MPTAGFPKVTGPSTPIAIRSQQSCVTFTKKTEGIQEGQFSTPTPFSLLIVFPPVSEVIFSPPTLPLVLLLLPQICYSSINLREEHLSHRFVVMVERDHIYKASRTGTGTYRRVSYSYLSFSSTYRVSSLAPQKNSCLSSSNRFLSMLSLTHHLLLIPVGRFLLLQLYRIHSQQGH